VIWHNFNGCFYLNILVFVQDQALQRKNLLKLLYQTDAVLLQTNLLASASSTKLPDIDLSNTQITFGISHEMIVEFEKEVRYLFCCLAQTIIFYPV
jgi:hypothetical protein